MTQEIMNWWLKGMVISICVFGLVCTACTSDSGNSDGDSTDTSSDTDTDTNEMVMDDFGIGFPCETPVDLFEPASPDYAVIKATGHYNDLDLDDHVADGQGSLEEYVDDVLWPMDYGEPIIGRKNGDVFLGHNYYLAIVFHGPVQEIAPNHTKDHFSVLFINSDLLPEMLAEDHNYLEPETEYLFSHVVNEEILDNADTHSKYCFNLTETTEIESKVFVCHEGNTEYAIGERIQIAGLIHLQILPEDDIYCFCELNDEQVDSCDDFDALAGE